MLAERFFPDEEAASAYEIDYEGLYAEGYRGVIFDIDNTLVSHGAPADERAIALFDRLHSLGFGTVCLSNNRELRVKPFCDAVNSLYIYKADKPAKRGYRKAMELMQTTVGTTLFVGDQLFTDVWGAKRTGMRNIKVEPICQGLGNEEIQIVLKRLLEQMVMYFYRKSIQKKENPER